MVLGRIGFPSTAQILKLLLLTNLKQEEKITSSCNDNINYIIKSSSLILKYIIKNDGSKKTMLFFLTKPENAHVCGLVPLSKTRT